jgi:hypothetical protein
MFLNLSKYSSEIKFKLNEIKFTTVEEEPLMKANQAATIVALASAILCIGILIQVPVSLN